MPPPAVRLSGLQGLSCIRLSSGWEHLPSLFVRVSSSIVLPIPIFFSPVLLHRLRLRCCCSCEIPQQLLSPYSSYQVPSYLPEFCSVLLGLPLTFAQGLAALQAFSSVVPVPPSFLSAHYRFLPSLLKPPPIHF